MTLPPNHRVLHGGIWSTALADQQSERFNDWQHHVSTQAQGETELVQIGSKHGTPVTVHMTDALFCQACGTRLVGILGGFAFAAVIQLVAIATILFSIATFMFLLALLAFVLSYAVVTETNTIFYAPGSLGAYALFDTYGAVFVLLFGIGLAGSAPKQPGSPRPSWH